MFHFIEQVPSSIWLMICGVSRRNSQIQHMLQFVGFLAARLGAGFGAVTPWMIQPPPVNRRADSEYLSHLVKVCIDTVQTDPQGKVDMDKKRRSCLI